MPRCKITHPRQCKEHSVADLCLCPDHVLESLETMQPDSPAFSAVSIKLLRYLNDQTKSLRARIYYMEESIK